MSLLYLESVSSLVLWGPMATTAAINASAKTMQYVPKGTVPATVPSQGGLGYYVTSRVLGGTMELTALRNANAKMMQLVIEGQVSLLHRRLFLYSGKRASALNQFKDNIIILRKTKSSFSVKV